MTIHTRRKSKIQSAMEYIMTYGWGILIIAVVLAGLYNIGVFNGQGNTARVQTGGCQIQRAGTTAGQAQAVNLVGLCQGQLQQFVGVFKGGGYVRANVTNNPTGSSSRTVAAWIYPTALPGTTQTIFSNGAAAAAQNFMIQISSNNQIQASDNSIYSGNTPAPLNGWAFVAVTYNGVAITTYVYIRGQLTTNSIVSSLNTPSDPSFIGTIGNGGNPGGTYFNGDMANIQIYNYSLSSNEIAAQYGTGISGAPVRTPSVVGWYQLNGNPYDSGGYQANGQPGGNLGYTNSWVSTYSQGS